MTLVTRRPILVGESNPYPCSPLAPDFPNSSGARLLRMINEVATMYPSEYEHAFDRRNLCRRQWSDKVAEDQAVKIHRTLRHGDVVVVLGHKVRRAMRLPRDLKRKIIGGVTFYWVPHPSGLNRIYNDPGTRRRVGRLLRRLAHG
jgi:hypothetical protein